jgi:hypothetical protein
MGLSLEKSIHNMHRLFSVDETGITVVQRKHSNVISLKEKKVNLFTSSERGMLFALFPPMMIWPRNNTKAELMDEVLAGFVAAFHISGRVKTDIFSILFNHFIKSVNLTPAEPVLLVLDGQSKQGT